MPTLHYKALPMQTRENSFYNSAIFLSLIGQLDDEDRFTTLFTRLFGETGTFSKFGRLQRELGHYQHTGVFPASLPVLMQQHFLPRLATYLRAHGASFLSSSVVAQIESSAQEIEQGRIDPLAQQALAHLLQARIQVYTQNAQHLSLNTTVGDSELVVSVLQENDLYEPLMDVSQLNAAQTQGLQSVPTLTFQSTERGLNTRQTFTDDALKALIQETIRILPDQLVAISSSVPNEPVFDSLVPSTELSLVRVDTPYPDLRLRNFTDTCDLLALRLAYQSSVVLFENDAVESSVTWAGSMSLTLLAGMGGGILGIGAIHASAEIGVAIAGGVIGAGAAAMAVVCVPVFVTCTLLTLIGGAVGKSYSTTYKQALKDANRHINEGEFEQAAAVLDAEFNRWGINRVLRRPFLTKAHYAVAHFFRGMCAEMLRQPDSPDGDFKKAYEEYQQALDDAKETDVKIVILLLHVKLIQLIRAHGQRILPPEQQADELIRVHLDELNHYFQDSLTHLYWQARKSIALVATACYQHQPFPPERLAWVQGVLNIQSLFILESYQKGRGTYLQVFHSFFQALTIAYFQFNRPQALVEMGLTHLSNKHYVLRHVLNRLADMFAEFNTFKRRYPTLANQPAFRRCHEMMTAFAQQFGGLAHSAVETQVRPLFDQALTNLAASLSINIQVFHTIANKHQRSTEFLMRLEEEFGLHFESIEAWLHALNDPRQAFFEAVRPRTHNNMLHLLAQLPEGMALDANVKSAAQRLQGMIYGRNHENHTPLSLLALNDVYGIKPLIIGPKLISLGGELDEVDEFIAGVERNVGSEGHFLLLQGPPGTGKTATVLTHLRSKGHVVREWESGGEGDQWVGQLNRRVSEFFQTGVAPASNRQNRSPRATILFIDEMSGVCPQVNGVVQNGHHNQAAVVDEFQRRITALRDHNVILVGATNYPERLSDAIQSRIARRVIFPVPDKEARQKLLMHLFREKCISILLMTRLVDLTQGWSPRQLAQMVEKMEGVEISRGDLDAVFERSRKIAQSDFRTEFSCAHLRLPQFEIPVVNSGIVPAGEVARVFDELRQSLIHPELYRGIRMHTLLYGPPGSGKTTAIREFAKQNNCPFILIESGTTKADLITIFERAKAFTAAIICIDEIDKIAFDGSPVKEFLQEQMDGLVANNIVVVGATNYPDRIAEPILDRLSVKVPVPLPTLEQRGLFIQQTIREKLTESPQLQLTPELQQEMNHGCLEFSRRSDQLSYRGLANSFGRLFARLRLEQQETRQAQLTVRSGDIVCCIEQARQSAREAVLARAEDMAAPRSYGGQFFRGDAANTQSASPSGVRFTQ